MEVTYLPIKIWMDKEDVVCVCVCVCVMENYSAIKQNEFESVLVSYNSV